MSKLNRIIIALLGVGAIAALSLTEVSRAGTKPVPKPAASEWSQFRGPNGTGVAETTGLPTEFGPTTNVDLEDRTASGAFVTGVDARSNLCDCLQQSAGGQRQTECSCSSGQSYYERELQAPGDRARSRQRKDSLAT